MRIGFESPTLSEGRGFSVVRGCANLHLIASMGQPENVLIKRDQIQKGQLCCRIYIARLDAVFKLIN